MKYFYNVLYTRVGYFLAPPFWRRLFGEDLFWRWDVVALVQRPTSVCNENGTQSVGERKTWIKLQYAS